MIKKLRGSLLSNEKPQDENVMWIDTSNPESFTLKLFRNGDWKPLHVVGTTRDMIERELTGYVTSHYHSYDKIINKPTTLRGYGITDCFNKTEIESLLNKKVTKVSGKSLSTNDFNNEYKKILDELPISYYNKNELDNLFNDKQDIITDLNNIREGAEKGNNASNILTNIVEAGYVFAGVATPTTNPGVPDAKVFYIANGKGTYNNFGGLEVTEDGVVVLYYDTAWHKVATGIASQAKLSELDKKVDKKIVIKCGKNLYNPDTNTPGYFINAKGNLQQNSDYSVTDYIPVTAGNYYLSEYRGLAINYKNTCINLYDAEYTKLDTVVGGSVDLTIPSGISYMRVTIINTILDIQIERGNTRTSYEPYSPIWGYIPNIADNSVGSAKLKASSVTGAKIANKSVSLEKTDFAQSVNIVVPADIHNKKYHNNADYNLYGSNNNYIATGLIDVKPNTTYYFKNFSGTSVPTARFVEFFNSEKERIDIQQYKSDVLSPDTASFVIVTFTKETIGSDTIDNIYVGEIKLSEYKPYKLQIQGSLIDPTTFDAGSILTNALKDKCVTQEKLGDGIHIDAAPAKFGVISSAMSIVEAGNILNTPFIRGYKNISLIVQIDSAFEEVKFGVDKDAFYQVAFILDSTNIKLVNGTASTEIWTEAHGLTLGSNTVALVTKNIDRDSAKITIFNDQGEYWEKSFRYGNDGGLPYLLNSGQSSITAKIGFELRDINEKIWLFGDSYFSYDGGDRWPYYLINAGFTRNLLSARGGDTPNSSLSSFINLLATGARPSFAVWCMGMNGEEDTGDTPNAEWLTPTTSFLELCEQYGITPILSTIPTVPSRNHGNRSAWVKSHDYRYIDFAAAVEVNDSDYWKNWGTAKAMLSSDEVHPTGYGAKALYQQVIRDFPEIMVTC